MNGTKPRLLIFINTLQSGGAERVVSLLLEHLKTDSVLQGDAEVVLRGIGLLV